MIIFYDLNWENWDHLMGTKGLAEQVDGCHLVKRLGFCLDMLDMTMMIMNMVMMLVSFMMNELINRYD